MPSHGITITYTSECSIVRTDKFATKNFHKLDSQAPLKRERYKFLILQVSLVRHTYDRTYYNIVQIYGNPGYRHVPEREKGFPQLPYKVAEPFPELSAALLLLFSTLPCRIYTYIHMCHSHSCAGMGTSEHTATSETLDLRIPKYCNTHEHVGFICMHYNINIYIYVYYGYKVRPRRRA